MEHKKTHRGNFSNKLGFVLAAAGSAVGLGNIWRFPYLAAQYGGGIFLLIYIILVVTFGYTVMVSEIAIGRKTGLSPYGAYKKLSSKYGFIGAISVFVAFFILSYYSVIGGWVMKYFAEYLIGSAASLAEDTYFASYISQPYMPIVWFFLFVAATFLVVINGVEKGIEKASKTLMPLLVILSLFTAIYAICLPGAMEGVKYLLIPNFEHFSIKTVLAAMGQMFYSMSLAMGIMITYGSYLKKSDDIDKSVKQIEVFDTGIAILAAFMIIPAIFSFAGGDSAVIEANLTQGPGLMFVTLPKVFGNMPFGGVLGGAFFLLVFFAAITSSISLMECVVSSLCDQTRLSRKKATILVAVAAFLVGIPSSLGNGIWSSFTILGMDILTFVDFLTNSVLMPIGAFLTCIFIGFIVGTKTVVDEVKLSSNFSRERIYVIVVKYVAPIFILAILVTSVLDAFDIFVF